jgi:hypothetical protein
MSKALYVVSGFMRTGTSMMMRALEAGGLDARYRQSRDVMKARFADEHYDPNVGGLYELEPRDYRRPDFPHGYEGTLIKALNLGVPNMAVMPGGIRVVFMRRDTEEVRQSYAAFFDRQLENVDHLDDRMVDIIARIRNRRDVVSLHVFWYREIIENPRGHFLRLQADGWPIDARAAAAVVDPELCRFRREYLTVGII